jgi:2-polyprenyl-3-methyl-5-hydroxy-6-metoxy-1,4-benzoquinol methylase
MMQSLPTAYGIWHGRYNVDSDANAPWHKLVRANLHPVRDLVDKRTLEIGCGRGGFSCWLSQHEAGRKEIVAADFSAVAIEKASLHATAEQLNSIRWEIADIQSIPHPSNSFNTVFSCETIEHVPNSRLALHEMSRVLKPGGRLFLTCPNYFEVCGLYRTYPRLVGRRYAEVGQPVNNLLIIPIDDALGAERGTQDRQG